MGVFLEIASILSGNQNQIFENRSTLNNNLIINDQTTKSGIADQISKRNWNKLEMALKWQKD